MSELLQKTYIKTGMLFVYKYFEIYLSESKKE